jgi:ribosome assembly protein YihI (activator of Der GTPase)
MKVKEARELLESEIDALESSHILATEKGHVQKLVDSIPDRIEGLITIKEILQDIEREDKL